MRFLHAIALTGLASQFAIVRIVRGRGDSRVFWSGFAVRGLAGGGILRLGDDADSRLDPSMAWRLWTLYAVFMVGVIRRLPHGHEMFDVPGHPVLWVSRAPQSCSSPNWLWPRPVVYSPFTSPKLGARHPANEVWV